MRRRALGSAVAALLCGGVLAAGCGGDGGNASRPTLDSDSALVDRKTTPYVNALERRDDGSFLLTTNKGFWRVAADGSDIEKIEDAVAVAQQGSSPVGTFLEIADVGTGDLLGSGHPDDPQALPQYLGIMRSNDGGKRWNVVTRLGTADIHIIRRHGSTLYLWDAVLGAVLISEDGLRSFAERFTPRQLVLDMVVDPKDPDYLLISTEEEMFRSTDQGEKWRPSGLAKSARLAWAETGELFRAQADGAFEVSSDRGQTWKKVGELPGEPWKIDLEDARTMWVALADGSIAETKDGGATWRVLFEAPDEL